VDKLNKMKYWEDKEIESLKKNYPTLTRSELEKKYKRSINNIYAKASLLKIKRGKFSQQTSKTKIWSLKEEQNLIIDWNNLSIESLINKYKRSSNSLEIKAKRIKLQHKKNIRRKKYQKRSKNKKYIINKLWTKKEEEVLICNYKNESPLSKLQQYLPGKTKHSISGKINRLQLFENNANKNTIPKLNRKWDKLNNISW